MAKKKATVRKWVTRKISTAPYESIDISADITEEIEYTNEESREKAMNDLTRVLVADLHRTIAQVLDELNLDGAKAKGSKMTFESTDNTTKSDKPAKTDKKADAALSEIFDGI